MKVLEIAIGLVLIYFLYSLLCTIITEMLSTWLGLRARHLRQGIENLFTDRVKGSGMIDFKQWLKDIFLIDTDRFKFSHAGKFYKQPEIQKLAKRGDNDWYSIRNTKPSYISAPTYIKTVLAMLCSKSRGITQWEQIKYAIKHNTIGLEKETLEKFENLVKNSNGKFENFLFDLESEFNEMMDRVNGWYKRKIGFFLFWIGFVICIAGNVDTFKIVKALTKNEAYRNELVANAERIVKSDISPIPKPSNAKDSLQRIQELKKQYNDIKKEITSSTEVLALSREYNPVNEAFDTCFTKEDMSNFYADIKLYIDTNKFTIVNNKLDDTSLIRMNAAIIKSIEKLNVTSNQTYFKVDSVNLKQKNNPIIYASRTPTFIEKLSQIFNDICRDPLSLLGIFITALALSLGAQFWFDLLKKLVALRGSGVKPEDPSSNMTAAPTKKMENDGNHVFSDDPFEIAISENRAKWEAMPGFVGFNKVNDAIEIAFESTQPAQPNEPLLTSTGIKVPLIYINRPKGRIDCSSNSVEFGENTLWIKNISSFGSIAGVVMNRRTGRRALLTAGHVVGNVKDTNFEMYQTKAAICNGNTWQEIGFVSNKMVTPYFDAGLIDIESAHSNKIDTIKTISAIGEINDSDIRTSSYLINTVEPINATLYDAALYHSLIYEDKYNLRFFELLCFQLNEGSKTKRGDSGALITKKVKDENNVTQYIPVAMHIGGGKIGDHYYSFALKLKDIFEALQIETIKI